MKGKLFLRSLAGLIDGMVVLLPAYMLLSVMEIGNILYQLLPQLLFVVYNAVSITSFGGKTIGKYFAGLSVYTEENGLLNLGAREMGKMLYFLPNVGVVFVCISLLMLGSTKQSLHDRIGRSKVLLDRERKEIERVDEYGHRVSR
ncbi:RDD family protein [Enterococcus sp. BWM-S5]|uniref:RDD family protein n=1 Tax=Enterococcus larvae TaxID=2794352 RepID=A0ABS4CIZ0_9ENTE|nr:RDD family protein [Enterococcus larvae]